MLKRDVKKINVEIDCGNDFCKPCHGLGWVALMKDGLMTDPCCNIFNIDLGKASCIDDAHRCPECRAAEVQ